MEYPIVFNNLDPDVLIDKMRDVIKEELQIMKLRESDQFISAAETCKLFKPAISKGTLIKWTRQGLLQDHRFGGRVYYKKSEIMEMSKKLKKYQSVLQ